jgi:hypothetical protein
MREGYVCRIAGVNDAKQWRFDDLDGAVEADPPSKIIEDEAETPGKGRREGKS